MLRISALSAYNNFSPSTAPKKMKPRRVYHTHLTYTQATTTYCMGHQVSNDQSQKKKLIFINKTNETIVTATMAFVEELKRQCDHNRVEIGRYFKISSTGNNKITHAIHNTHTNTHTYTCRVSNTVVSTVTSRTASRRLIYRFRQY